MNVKASIKRILYRLFFGTIYPRRAFGAMGRGCHIGKSCTLVPRQMYLDDYVIVQNLVNVIASEGKVVVKKYSVISSQCIIIPGLHMAAPGVPFYYQAKERVGDENLTICIDEDCWVGAGAILLRHCHLGRGSVVGAGSVVTKDFPPYAVVAGNPAKIIGVKFSKADILAHEAAIYPPEERMSEANIDALFQKYFAGLKPMKKCAEAEIASFRKTHNLSI